MKGWRRQSRAGIEYFERAGAGAPLVLLHGIGSRATSFEPLLPHLPPDRRVIAWNAPGYGGSAPLAPDWPTAADYAAALERLLDAADVGEALLVGHSLGCLIGASFAAARRERVRRLALASPALGHGVARGGRLSAAAQARLDDLERLGPEGFARARAAGLVHDAENNPEVVAQVYRAMSEVNLPGYGQAARMLACGRLLDDAQRLRMPTDVIVGAEDRITPPDGARRAHEELRGVARGRFICVPAAGHALYQQAPAAFAAALDPQIETAG